MEIKKRLGGSNQIILSTNEYLKLHRYEIILFHQAQPRPNNLDKLETPTGNPNTPLRCKYV